jgi:hypothetical protein
MVNTETVLVIRGEDPAAERAVPRAEDSGLPVVVLRVVIASRADDTFSDSPAALVSIREAFELGARDAVVGDWTGLDLLVQILPCSLLEFRLPGSRSEQKSSE